MAELNLDNIDLLEIQIVGLEKEIADLNKFLGKFNFESFEIIKEFIDFWSNHFVLEVTNFRELPGLQVSVTVVLESFYSHVRANSYYAQFFMKKNLDKVMFYSHYQGKERLYRSSMDRVDFDSFVSLIEKEKSLREAKGQLQRLQKRVMGNDEQTTKSIRNEIEFDFFDIYMIALVVVLICVSVFCVIEVIIPELIKFFGSLNVIGG